MTSKYQLYFLTDGTELFNSKVLDPDELKEHQEFADKHGGGNFTWVSGIRRLPKNRLFQHIVRKNPIGQYEPVDQ